VVEYIDPADEQFQRILRGRDSLHRDLTPDTFEQAALRYFRIVERCAVTATRTLYVFERAVA
jgi:hypothetical protein